MSCATAAFGPGAAFAAEIYGEHLDQLVSPCANSPPAGLHHHQPLLRWAPPNEPVQRCAHGSGLQFTDEDGRQFVEDARREYRGDSAIQTALDTYVRNID